MNEFLNEMNKTARTENGALSYVSSLSVLVDQFGNAANYRNRDIDDVFADQSKLWNENSDMALRFPFYLRMVTRKIKFGESAETETIQKGQGCKDEALKRYLWLAKYQSKSFYKNLWAIPVVGSWKDIWVLLYYDTALGLNVLDKTEMFKLIQDGIEVNHMRDLVKKFMPRIRSNNQCNSHWAKISNKSAKEFCKFSKWSMENYRLFKSTGEAHKFQQDICNRNYDSLNFNTIPGRALSNIVKGNFLSKHNLEKKYIDFINAKPVAKFTGYPYELIKSYIGFDHKNSTAKVALYKKMTIDKQFEQLLLNGKDNGGINENVLCCLDTSGSMSRLVNDTICAGDIATSLAIYFSSLNNGAFKDKIIAFDDNSKLISLNGTFTDKVNQIYKDNDYMGSTNFQSVVDEIVRIRKLNPNINLSDYPTTFLVVSDMQFNPTRGNYYQTIPESTNSELMRQKLLDVFPESYVNSIKYIWWQVTERATDVPATINQPGNILISGFDGSIISLILGGNTKTNMDTTENVVPSMKEVVLNALNQEILTLINKE